MNQLQECEEVPSSRLFTNQSADLSIRVSKFYEVVLARNRLWRFHTCLASISASSAWSMREQGTCPC